MNALQESSKPSANFPNLDCSFSDLLSLIEIWNFYFVFNFPIVIVCDHIDGNKFLFLYANITNTHIIHIKKKHALKYPANEILISFKRFILIFTFFIQSNHYIFFYSRKIIAYLIHSFSISFIEITPALAAGYTQG